LIKQIQRHKPHVLLAYEALFRSLRPKYRNNEILVTNYQNYRAGFQGEKRVDYHLSLFPHKDFFHFPSIRLRINRNSFQLDSLILTRKLIFNIEIKNWKGILEYNSEQKQLVQYNGDKEFCYKDPLLQAEIQKRQLQLWLQQFGLKTPVESVVVCANSNTIIRNPHHDKIFNKRFLSLENLFFRLEEIYDSYSENNLSRHETQSLFHKFIQHDEPLTTDLISLYNLKKHQFISGMACPTCDHFPLKRHFGFWQCQKCHQQSIDSHKRKILDYFLLHKPVITNKICRELLQVTSPDTAYQALKSMKLNTVGKNKKRKYLAPKLHEFPQDAIPKQFEISILDR